MSNQNLFSESVLKYIKGFEQKLPELPDDIHPLLPYQQQEVRNFATLFYNKFYKDNKQRSLILGINPGRLGAGLTGIPFTDAKRLQENCGIPNIIKTHEPSSVFIYQMIQAFGGVQDFYGKYFISSISPIGFMKDGKNYNYYDNKKLLECIKPYIVFQINQLLKLDLDTRKVYCLGEGKNYHFLTILNKSYHWFKEINALPHPRYVVQYKQKQMADYIDLYLKLLK